VLLVWAHPEIDHLKATLAAVRYVGKDHILIGNQRYQPRDGRMIRPPWPWPWFHQIRRWHIGHFEIDTPAARMKYGVPLNAVPLTPLPHHPNDRRLKRVEVAA
jgi:hypothetical protein